MTADIGTDPSCVPAKITLDDYDRRLAQARERLDEIGAGLSRIGIVLDAISPKEKKS